MSSAGGLGAGLAGYISCGRQSVSSVRTAMCSRSDRRPIPGVSEQGKESQMLFAVTYTPIVGSEEEQKRGLQLYTRWETPPARRPQPQRHVCDLGASVVG